MGKGIQSHAHSGYEPSIALSPGSHRPPTNVQPLRLRSATAKHSPDGDMELEKMPVLLDL